MLTEWFRALACENYNSSAIPAVTCGLLEDASRLLRDEFNAEIVMSGSFNSRTCVKGFSDIDMLAVFDAGNREDNFKYMKMFTVGAHGLFCAKLRRLDVDIVLSPPAICICHLSQPKYQIEITPAVTAASLGIYAPNSDDYMILADAFNNLTATNPNTQRKVTESLNYKTNGGFSYISNLLKLWKYRNKVPMISFALEVFVYHWLRGTCDEGSFPLMEALNFEVNLDFPFKRTFNCLDKDMLFILEDLLKQLKMARQNNHIYSLTNPYVQMKIPNNLFNIFNSMGKQEEGLFKIEKSISVLKKAIDADENGKEKEARQLMLDFLNEGGRG